LLDGVSAGQFSLTDACSGTTLAAGGECEVEVLFAPGSDGAHVATLEIPSTVGSEGVALSGIGRTPTGALSIDPMSLDFGTQQTGTTSGPRTVTLANSGDAALAVGQLTFAGSGATQYSLPGDGCSETALAAGDECEVQVVFAPDEDGSHVATLEVPSSSGTMQVELAGIGRTPTGAIATAPASLDFGTLPTGTASAPQEVTVTNSGDAPLTLGELGLGGPDASQFSLAAGCSGTTLAPGEGCAVAVAFAPSAAGELSAALEIPSSVGSQTVPLAGVGQAPPSSPPTGGGSPSGAGAGTGTTTSGGESADLRIHLDASRRSAVGEELTAELTIANRGPDTARSIEVTASFGGVEPSDLEIHGSHCRGRHKIECAIPRLAPGRRVKLKIAAIPRRPGPLKITAAVRGVTADGSATSDRDHLTVKVAPRRRQ
jgi:hypothetical protein